MTAPEPTPQRDPQIELAKERNRIAADRTLLAWIRLSLTLIGIGFGTDQTVLLLATGRANAIAPNGSARLAGLALVGLGIFALVLAALDYHRELNQLQQPIYQFAPRLQLGEKVAIALLAIALLYFVNLGYKLVQPIF